MAEPLVCSVTYLRVRSPLVIPAFLLQTWRVTRAARRTPGYVTHRLLGMPLVRRGLARQRGTSALFGRNAWLPRGCLRE